MNRIEGCVNLGSKCLSRAKAVFVKNTELVCSVVLLTDNLHCGQTCRPPGHCDLQHGKGCHFSGCRTRIIKEKGISQIEHYCYEEHEEIRRAAVECLCNMVVDDEVCDVVSP